MTTVTTFQTENDSALGAICDIVKKTVEKGFGFKVINVLPLKDVDERHYEIESWRIHYVDSNGMKEEADFKASAILYMIGVYASRNSESESIK